MQPALQVASKAFLFQAPLKSLHGSSVVGLPHPKSGEVVKYVVTADALLEVQCGLPEEDLGCWLAHDHISGDPALYMATIVDPLFLMIPVLEKARKKTAGQQGYFCSLDQILMEASSPHFSLLRPLLPTTQLANVCDVKEIADTIPTQFRINDDKVLGWLKRKVGQIIQHLQTHSEVFGDAVISSRAASSSLVRVEKTKVSEAEILHAAVGLISEYLAPALLTRLAEAQSVDIDHLGLSDTRAAFSQLGSGPARLPSNSSDGPSGKQANGGGSSGGSAGGKSAPKKPAPSASQSRLQKVDKKNVQSISTFFKKK